MYWRNNLQANAQQRRKKYGHSNQWRYRSFVWVSIVTQCTNCDVKDISNEIPQQG